MSTHTKIVPDPSLERAVTAVKGFNDTALWSELERAIAAFVYPPGQVCDLGGIASAVHIHAAGWHPVLLGSSVPAEQTVAAATKLNARAVIVSAVTDTYDTTVLNEMVRVRRGVPAAVPVFFGGRMPDPLVEDIVAGGLVALQNMTELREQLGALISHTPG